jgi:hypothetical protein
MSKHAEGPAFSGVIVRAVESTMAPLIAEMEQQTLLLRAILRQAKRGPIPLTHKALAEYAGWQHIYDPYGGLAAAGAARHTIGVYQETRSEAALDALLVHSVELQRQQLLLTMSLLTQEQATTGLLPSAEVMAAFAARAGVKPTEATAEDAPAEDAPPVESPETGA